MNNLVLTNSGLPNTPERKPDRIETYSGKKSVRLTKVFKNEDGSETRLTRKINQDFSITDKVEYRHL